MTPSKKTTDIDETAFRAAAANLKQLVAEHDQANRMRGDAENVLFAHGKRRRELQGELEGRSPLHKDRINEIEVELASLVGKVIAAEASRRDALAKQAEIAPRVIKARDELSVLVGKVIYPERQTRGEAFDRAARDLVDAFLRMAELDQVVGRELFHAFKIVDPRNGFDLTLRDQPFEPTFPWLPEVRSALAIADAVYIPPEAVAAE